MNLKFLETFIRVVRLGGFSAAAERLGTTQAAVSHRISVLEAEIGTRLFEREGRGVRLSQTGQSLIGSIFQINTINLVKGAPQSAAAKKFVNYALSPEAQIARAAIDRPAGGSVLSRTGLDRHLHQPDDHAARILSDCACISTARKGRDACCCWCWCWSSRRCSPPPWSAPMAGSRCFPIRD